MTSQSTSERLLTAPASPAARRTRGSVASRAVMRAIRAASTGSVLPCPGRAERSREVSEGGTSTTSMAPPSASLDATPRPQLPDPSMPTRRTWCSVSRRSSTSNPASVLATSRAAIGRPAASMIATARVSCGCRSRPACCLLQASEELATPRRRVQRMHPLTRRVSLPPGPGRGSCCASGPAGTWLTDRDATGHAAADRVEWCGSERCGRRRAWSCSTVITRGTVRDVSRHQSGMS